MNKFNKIEALDFLNKFHLHEPANTIVITVLHRVHNIEFGHCFRLLNGEVWEFFETEYDKDSLRLKFRRRLEYLQYGIPRMLIPENAFKQNKWKMPTIELVKYVEKKGVTVVKFKGIKKAVKSKCSPNETFSKYQGLVTCLLKQSSGMSNQELKRYLEHAEKKTVSKEK